MKPPNVFGAVFEYDPEDPAGYRAGAAAVGKQAGGEELALKLYELPPGESLCPYHYEYVEEWLLVLDGAVTLRDPAGERALARGDLVCFVPGPDGAHKLTGAGAGSARVVMFSSSREPAVAVYPDSDKIGVWPGRREDHVMLRRADGHAGYYEGE
ncbi:MAG: cupin domain-containing protein [Solirubrobacteraceae bacterium]